MIGLLLALAAAGLAAGFVSGLMGVGGGIIMTPVLHYLAGYTWPEAVALSLFVIAVQAPVGLWRHHGKGVVKMRMALPLVAGGIGGVALGIWLEPRVGVPALKIFFALLMAFAAYRLVKDGIPRREGWRPHTAILIIIGFAAGVVSRLLGVGGGILTVPVLALMGVSPHVAVGSSLVPVWTNAVAASAVNLAQDLPWQQAIPLAIGALAGAPIGVWAAHALDARRLRRVVAGGLVLVALLVAFDALRAA